MASTIHDVAVIGGGPAGATVARLLARAGRSVVLVDEHRRARGMNAELMPWSAEFILRELDLLDMIDGGPHVPAIPDGWHLDRARFDADLVHLAVHAGATLVSGRALAFDLTSAGWEIRVAHAADDDEAVSARFVVDASGRSAVVATRFGAERVTEEPRFALVTMIEDNRNDDDRRLIVEHAPSGVLVSAPLPARRRIVALHADQPRLRAILATPIELNLRIRRSALVSPLIHPRARIAAPVLIETGASQLDRCVGHRWLAVGDAARSFDPLGDDHGIVLALESAVDAARAIDEAMHDRPDALDAYARAAA